MYTKHSYNSGSKATLISESLVNKLRIKRSNARISVKGLGSSEAAVTRGLVNVNTASIYGSDKIYLQIDAVILSKLTSDLPSELVCANDLSYLCSTNLDIEIINNGGFVTSKSSISSVCPFLDEKDILQVVGHLQNSQLNFNAKHPIIIHGPVTVTFNKGRGSKTTKGHIVLYVCLTTKAFHIEAVSDLTADELIAAFRREIETLLTIDMIAEDMEASAEIEERSFKN
ncbi:hypothetical protein NPIL_353201 [Nephila pilipes]|uniref:Uncharacterized protein n=1 Tax=Nephila pilipes TaxID=299642 RepID=A0A8X6QM17_NEPPI|nr:hypothetical protein NPIL_353201 [Nephila pilipes]